MANFPSVITSFTNPLATDRLNAPSHSAVETAQNAGLTQVQTFIGVEGPSSTLGTLIYDIRSPGSNGGGHVQGVNKGGTNFTSYTKGDILIASSSSVLTKLAVGVDNQTLVANSSVATGVNWVNQANTRVYVKSSFVGMGTPETSVYSTSVMGSTLGTGANPNAVIATAYIQNWQTRAGAGPAVIAVQYGGQPVGSVAVNSSGDDATFVGTITHTILASTASLQKHFLDVQATTAQVQNGAGSLENITFITNSPARSSIISIRAFSSVVSSVESSANQIMGMTVILPTNNNMTIGGIVIRKII